MQRYVPELTELWAARLHVNRNMTYDATSDQAKCMCVHVFGGWVGVGHWAAGLDGCRYPGIGWLLAVGSHPRSWGRVMRGVGAMRGHGHTCSKLLARISLHTPQYGTPT